jgi:serine/threonine protein kinase
MNNSNSNNVHVKEILNNIPKENFQLVKVFNSGLYDSHYIHAFSNGVAVVKNNKLAGRLEDIKLLESLEPESRKRFLREGKILSAMNHKNIPQVYDILEYEDWLLFRYEHVDGYSLKEVLDYFKKKKMVFPKYAATVIILKVLNALYYAHNGVKYDSQKRSIIHCDIKPSNIILYAKDYDRKGNIDKKFITLLKQNRVEPFLIDFGIAKFRGKANIDGTINYLSPAQVGKRKLDWRTDVYQLLLVYYEILTMKVPYSNLSRKKILEEKIKHDFTLDKKSNIDSGIKEFIEEGTKRATINSFKSEKDCIKALSAMESSQKRLEFFRKYKKPLLITVIVVLCLVLFFFAYKVWDYETQSIDAIIRRIEKNPNPTIEELEIATARIQTRAFEKKYYKPLLNGEFRDKDTGKPLYPSHLNANGNWILVGPETESAGMFVGLLFEYSDKYPKLLDYAKEYAEPILESEFDGTGEKRFMYALIPGYEKTQDERYLKKLINVSDTLISSFDDEYYVTQCSDMYHTNLFLFVYEVTGKEKYLKAYNSLVTKFVRNNIDTDGYIYDVAGGEYFTSNYLSSEKWTKLVTPLENTPIGTYFDAAGSNIDFFKNVTSPFSKDFMEVLLTLQKMYLVTGDETYKLAFERSLKYYSLRLPSTGADYLFVSYLNSENSIPIDILTTVKTLYIFRDYDFHMYHQKLQLLLSKKYFRGEDKHAVLKGTVLIENNNYVHSDETKKNQSTIEVDALFLELKTKNKNYSRLTASLQ